MSTYPSEVPVRCAARPPLGLAETQRSRDTTRVCPRGPHMQALFSSMRGLDAAMPATGQCNALLRSLRRGGRGLLGRLIGQKLLPRGLDHLLNDAL